MQRGLEKVEVRGWVMARVPLQVVHLWIFQVLHFPLELLQPPTVGGG